MAISEDVEDPRPVASEHEPAPAAARGHGGFLTRVFRETEEANRRAILAALPAGAGGALLDIGCHQGDFTVRVAERLRAAAVSGVELLAQHAAVARARGIDVAEADLEAGLPYPDLTFDFVTANQVIEHLRGTDVLLREIARVLRPDGIAVVSTNNMSSWHNVVSLAFGLQPNPMHVSDEIIVGNPLNPENGLAHEDIGRSHMRLFTGRALSELAAHHGLRTIALETVGYYPLPPRIARWATRVDRRHGAFLVAKLGVNGA